MSDSIYTSPIHTDFYILQLSLSDCVSYDYLRFLDSYMLSHSGEDDVHQSDVD